LLGPAVLLALWETLSATGTLDEGTLAAPATVVRTAWDLVADGTLPQNLVISLRRIVLGLAIGVVVGLVLAVASGLTALGEDLIDAPVQMVRAMPILALVPLDIIWFGIGEQAKIVLIAFAVVFPIYLNTHAAIRRLDPRFLELATTLRLTRRQVVRRVVLPGALPGFFTGLRFAAAIAWLVLVVSEQINANQGLGYLMNKAQEFDQTDVVVVGLLVYGALGLVSDALVRRGERAALAWQPQLEVR
jgi:sulfonate transport system permease protein